MFDLERKRDRAEPASHSVLGLQEPESKDEPRITHSFLGLEDDSGRPLALSKPGPRPRPGSPAAAAAAAATPAPIGASPRPLTPAPKPAVPSGFAPPEFMGGRSRGIDEPGPEPLRELFDLERKSDQQGFPVERGILISIGGHILFFLLLLYWPFGNSSGSRSLFPTFAHNVSKIDEPFPIIFRSAPGPERESRNAREFSDKNRRAGGGDRSRPKSDTPFVPERPGREGLAPGAGAIASSQPPPSPPQRRGEAPRQGQVAPPEKAADSENIFRQPAGSPSSPSSTQEPGKLANLDQAIREAAKGVGAPGQGGSGFPNPDGGFVDSGPLSFETSWYDWGPYADEMVRRIKLHWDVPKLAELGWKGKLTIHFSIRLDGSVEGATLVSGSGIPPFDFAAMQAILKSNPFRPLPKDLIREVPGKTKEGVTVTFFYNMRPSRGDSSGSGS